MKTPKTIIEVVGEITDSERQTLHAKIRNCSLSDMIPGDGVVIAEEDGKPWRIAYLNRRIHVKSLDVYCKFIFEVGVPAQTVATESVDRQKLYEGLKDFVVRKSAVFARPDLAAKELTDFFIKFTGG